MQSRTFRRFWFRLFLLPGINLCFLGVASGCAGELRAGAVAVNITPAIAIGMNGGTAPVISTHVHDELHARCLQKLK
jgi:neutral ceramidase